MNSTGRSTSLACLRVPDLDLPTSGIEFSTVLLQLIITHAFVQAFHRLFSVHLSLTPIVSQMFVGIFFSPMTPWQANNYYNAVHLVIFPSSSRNPDESLAMISYMMYSYIIAVKMDFSIILKTGKKAFVIGILDSILPIVLSLGALLYVHPEFLQGVVESTDQDVADLYINLTTLPLTHFPNVATFLFDMRMMSSELGRLALSSALIGHILSMLLLVIANILTRQIYDPLKLITPFALVIVSIFVFRPILCWMIKQTPKGKPVNQLFVSFGYLLMFVGALTTQYAEQLVVLGAFIIGAVVPDGLPMGAAIVEKLEFFVTGLLLPFFVVTAFMGGDYMHLGDYLRVSSKKIISHHDHHAHHDDEHSPHHLTSHHLSIAVIAYFAKFFNSLFCGLYSKMAFTDALALSFIMSIKGIVDVGTLILFRESEVLSTPSYTVMIIWSLLIATITPPVVKLLYHPLKKYAGYQRRDILHCRYISELRILACFLRSDRIPSITRLISACCPSDSNKVVVFALHLVKLVGRAHPIFIAHDMQKKKVSKSTSYSDDVIWSFHRFVRDCNEFLSIHIFTAVSHFESLNEDTCTLALDKLVSIIVLPFHRKFRHDGSIESDDNEQKTLNAEILSKSPCSVAVLVDRGSFGRASTGPALTTIASTNSNSPPPEEPPLLVAVIYIGGLDDQETLALAKRMGRDLRVRVFVIRLVSSGQPQDLNFVESSALMDIQRNVLYNQQFSYTEEMVRDGGDTATFLQSMVASYDLVMVRRHFNSDCTQLVGLKEANEETGLGAIGDYLASNDVVSRTSILVVQQQRYVTS